MYSYAQPTQVIILTANALSRMAWAALLEHLLVTNIQYCHHIRPRLRKQMNSSVRAATDL